MKVFKSRVAICAMMSVLAVGAVRADTPAADYKTVTSKAYVDSLISDSDVSTNTVNGAPLSNEASYFYGISDTGASAGAKRVTISSIRTLAPGQIIVVKPENTSNYNGAHTLQLSNDRTTLGDPAPIYYNGAAVSDAATGALVWTANVPSTFVYELGQGRGDPNKWRFMGHGLDNDTKIMAGTADDVVTYSGTAGTTGSRGVINNLSAEEITALSGYSVTLDGTTGNWPTADATSLVSGTGLADALSRKQHKIAAMASTYDSTTTPTANGALITATTTAGSVGQRGIATAPVYITENNVTTLGNANWIPTMGAVMDAVGNATSGTINGMSVTGTGGYFYDNAGGGAASSCAKTASIPSIDTLAAGQVIVVTPATTSTCSGAHTLALNGGNAAPIYYDGAAIPHAGIAAYVWAAGRPSTFVYDGTKWLFIGDPMMSVSDGRAATNTTPRVVGPMALKAIVHGLTLSTVSGAGITALSLNTNQSDAITTSDTIIGAFGKLQGQILSLKNVTSDLNGQIINGMSFGEQPLQFAGPESGEPQSTNFIRVADIPAMPTVSELSHWTVVVVRPIVTADPSSDPGVFDHEGLSLAINKPNDYLPILYNGAAVTDATAPIVWTAGVPSIFVYSKNDSAWLFAGHGADNDTGAALVGNKVNGAPLSNTSSYYYGTGNASATGITVRIPSIASAANTLPGTGQIIVVQPTNKLDNQGCNTSYWTLGLNDFTAAPVVYNGGRIGCNVGADSEAKSIVWDLDVPSMFVFDGTHWVFLGHGLDKNTTYDELTSDASGAWSGPAGTGTTAGVISPETLKNSIHRVNLTANRGTTAWTATNSPMTTSDTLLDALGKAQGQIDNRQYMTPETGKYTQYGRDGWQNINIQDYDAAEIKGTSLPTKTGSAGAVGERMIVDSGTDTTGWAAAKLANAIPSMSKISGLIANTQSQKVCYEYKPGTDLNNATDADCWLWRLP